MKEYRLYDKRLLDRLLFINFLITGLAFLFSGSVPIVSAVLIVALPAVMWEVEKRWIL